MSKPLQHEITRVLDAISDGDAAARERLLPLTYDELRRIARARMARERPGHSLQPTALVHEAYLRLFGTEEVSWENRGHFYAAAAEAMRRILIESARRRARVKRGGDLRQVSLGDAGPGVGPRPDELLALDLALEKLEGNDERMALVVKLRYFAGLTLEETACAMNVSERLVSKLWTAARAWLSMELASPRAGAGGDDAH